MLTRLLIIVELRYVAEANRYAETWDPDTGGHETFGDLKLSKSGSDTHSACCTSASPEMYEMIMGGIAKERWAEVVEIREEKPVREEIESRALVKVEARER